MKRDNVFYDKDFRTQVRGLDQESLAALVTSSIEDVDVEVVTNTKDTLYFVIPIDYGSYQLESVQAGSPNTAATAATAGCIACASSSLSSLACASSLSTSGCD